MPASAFRPSLLSSAILVLAASAAQAQDKVQDKPQDKPQKETLDTVVINASADASKDGLSKPYAGGQVARGGRVGILGGLDIMDTPFSTTAYTQQLIQDQQAQSIADVLQNDSAVRVARGFGNYQQAYIVRGLPVFSDDMSYNGLYGLLPRQYLAAELVERVEVLRGASAFLNGAAPGGSGLGGAVNVAPKRAPNQALNEFTIGYEQGGAAYVAADVARRFGDDRSTGVRVNVLRRDGGSGEDRQSLSLAAIGVDHRAGALRVSADLGWQDHRLDGTQPSVTIGAGLPIPRTPDADEPLAQPWTHSYARDTFGTLRAEYDLSDQITAWAAYGARHGDESIDVANPTTVNAAGDTLAYRYVGSRRDRISTGEIGLRAQLATGPVSHRLVASAATYKLKSSAPYVFSDFGPAFLGTIPSNLYAPVSSAPPVATTFPGVSIDDTSTHSVAIADTLGFMQDQLMLTLGLRRQTIKSGDYAASRTTPVGGLVYKLSKSLSVYGSYVEGLVKGDIAPATAGFGGPPVANAGEVFAPYQTKQGELGLKLDSGHFGGTLSVFRSRKPVYSVNAATLRFEQTDQQRNEGAELSFFGEAMPGLALLGGYSYLKAEVAGKEAIGAPRSQFNLGVDWTVPGIDGLTLNARAMHTASQYADSANTQVVPAWTRLDAGAAYAMSLGTHLLTLRARVDNLANRNYWASSGGYPGYGYLTLGAPRTYSVSATYSY